MFRKVKTGRVGGPALTNGTAGGPALGDVASGRGKARVAATFSPCLTGRGHRLFLAAGCLRCHLAKSLSCNFTRGLGRNAAGGSKPGFRLIYTCAILILLTEPGGLTPWKPVMRVAEAEGARFYLADQSFRTATVFRPDVGRQFQSSRQRFMNSAGVLSTGNWRPARLMMASPWQDGHLGSGDGP